MNDELLAKIEAATGPNHDLDIRLYCIERGQKYEPETAWTDARGRIITRDWNVPNYTSSIDAALALVERMMPNAMWSIRTGMEGGYAADLPFVKLRDMHPSPALHRTAPLAILAALLKAMTAPNHHPQGEER